MIVCCDSFTGGERRARGREELHGSASVCPTVPLLPPLLPARGAQAGHHFTVSCERQHASKVVPCREARQYEGGLIVDLLVFLPVGDDRMLGQPKADWPGNPHKILGRPSMEGGIPVREGPAAPSKVLALSSLQRSTRVYKRCSGSGAATDCSHAKGRRRPTLWKQAAERAKNVGS